MAHIKPLDLNIQFRKILDYKWHLFFLSANPIMICLILVRFMNQGYPFIGHDYTYQIPQMLDTAIFVRNNGLGIQWYTPSFGAGLPAFPNPNNIQFSLSSQLSLLVEPWLAILITSIFFVCLGFFASVYLYHRVLKLHWTLSVLGAVFFSANGFIMERMAVGHIGFQIFPALAVILICFIDSTIPIQISILVFSFIIALALQQAGYFVIILFALSMLMIFPLFYLFRPGLFSWKRFFLVPLLGGMIALMISASKLSAVFAFMRFFPRQIADSPPINPILGILGIIFQLLGTMNLLPIFWVTKIDPIYLAGLMQFTSQSLYGFWEYDMSLSPAVIGIIIITFYRLLRNPRKLLDTIRKDGKWIAFLVFIFSTILCLEFTLRDGLIYPRIRDLPILSSLHVNSRFAASFIFPVTLVAILVLNSQFRKWSRKRTIAVFLTLNLLTLLSLTSFLTFENSIQGRNYDVSDSSMLFQSIRSGADFEITKIGFTKDNTKALQNHTSNLNPYEPIFGYQRELFHVQATPGSVWKVSDGVYNFTNPTGYVFPEINNSHAFDLVPGDDKQNLQAFVKYLQPNWKIPIYQQILDWVSGLTAWSAAMMFIIFGMQESIKTQKSISIPLPKPSSAIQREK